MKGLLFSSVALAVLLVGQNQAMAQSTVPKWVPTGTQSPPGRISGTVSPSPGSTATATYQSGANGYVKAAGNSDGTAWSGQLSKNSSNFNYSSPNGTSVGGGYTYQNSKNYSVSGNYQAPSGYGYGGSVGKTNGHTFASGEYNGPILVGGVPVAQAKVGGTTVFAGANSTISTNGNLYTPVGGVKVVGVGDQIDRHNWANQQQVGIGPARVNDAGNVHFSGINSTYSNSQKFSAPGVGVQSGLTANTQGVSTNVGAHIGGESVGVGVGVNGKGIHVTTETPKLPTPHTTLPNVTFPKLTAPPKVKVPEVTLPKVSLPKVSVPKISKPKW